VAGSEVATPLWKFYPHSKSGVTAALQFSLRFASAGCHRTPNEAGRFRKRSPPGGNRSATTSATDWWPPVRRKDGCALIFPLMPPVIISRICIPPVRIDGHRIF